MFLSAIAVVLIMLWIVGVLRFGRHFRHIFFGWPCPYCKTRLTWEGDVRICSTHELKSAWRCSKCRSSFTQKELGELQPTWKRGR
jgi:transposase-like protein